MLVDRSWSTLKTQDLIIILIDATKDLKYMDHILLNFSHYNKATDNVLRVVACLNKIDIVRSRKYVDEFYAKLIELKLFDKVFKISAMKKIGFENLERYIMAVAPKREWEYEKETKTTQTTEERVLEIIREKLFRRFNNEIPYRLRLSIAFFQESSFHMVVDVKIISPTKSITTVLYSGLNYLQERSIMDLQKIFQKNINLKFFVSKSKKNNDDF
jgi:GTPase